MFEVVRAHDYFEQQYVLRKSLPGFAAHVAEWEALSADVHFAGHSFQVEPYGSHPRQTLELFKAQPGEQGRGLAVFIHGGFWRAMQREQSRFMARPFLKRGWDCAILEYRLMPQFPLRDLIDDAAAALRYLTEHRRRLMLAPRMLIAGHSAGAHLALYATTVLRTEGFPLGETGLLFFSGVFDIHPVAPTSLGDETKVTPDEVAAWSLYSGASLGGQEAVFVVGGAETPDFQRQSLLGAQQLCQPGADEVLIVAGANHLTLLTQFTQDEALCDAILGRLRAFAI
jgi:arylformamidase